MNEDKGTRYQRLKRRTTLLSYGWSACLLAVLALGDGARALRDIALHVTSAAPEVLRFPASAIVFVFLLSLLNEIGSLPLGFYGGFALERKYGLSTQPLRGWLGDQLKSWVIGFLISALGAATLYFLIRRSPGDWWLPAGLLFGGFIVALANLGPVLLLPLFYTLKPLEKAPLKERLMTLANRAGARVLDAYEWGLGSKTSKANAALTGIGATRRILVSDTMLAEYSDEEIEVVLAHELAHHVHGDIWKGIALESALVLSGFFAAARVLQWAVEPLGLASAADLAGVPLLLLAAGAVSVVALPVVHAMSRAYERRADRFALELTRNPVAFVSAMRRLSAQNLAEEHPSRAVQLLFYSHPPTKERIAAAQAFRI